MVPPRMLEQSMAFARRVREHRVLSRAGSRGGWGRWRHRAMACRPGTAFGVGSATTSVALFVCAALDHTGTTGWEPRSVSAWIRRRGVGR